MKNEITTSDYWAEYWKTKKSLETVEIGANFLFSDIINEYVPKTRHFSFIEIGGFPGYWAVFFAKYFNAQATLIDRYIDKHIVKQISLANDSPDISVIEGDIFELQNSKKFDVVMSVGLIEHFFDVSAVIDMHIKYLEKNGILIIVVPNFLGANGLLQKIIDKPTYDTHYLEVMNDKKLRNIIKDKHMEIKHLSYYGKFGFWLEDIANKPRWLRRTVYIVNVIGKLIFRFETRMFSPYLVLVAQFPKSND